MNSSAVASGEAGGLSRLWNRRLARYPDTRPRTFYLAIVVFATIVLYYELYVQGAVAPAVIAHFHMSFLYFVYISVVGNAVGAFASLIAGLADRWGRANLVTYGVGVTAVLAGWVLPNMGSELTYAVVFAAVSFVEGIILVATPALVRDFSPQLGRASAMGFWTLGPVVGSLLVAEVSSHTLSSATAAALDWQPQFEYAGIAGLIVFVVALFGLRELSPGLRDQLMVSLRDRALIEARAQGVDVAESLRHPWRQMLHLDVVGPAFAISVFLLIYYAAVGFFVIYFTTVFGFSEAQANGLGNWFWAFDAGALIVTGIVSDLVKVRKPFMLAGALGAIALTTLFSLRATQPHTGYYTFVFLISLLAVFLAVAYAPWMAAFTETVERRNPALTATGLAVWGWIIRAVVAISTIFLPVVVTAVTPLVEHGSAVAAVQARYPTEVRTLSAIDPATLAVLQKQPTNAAADARAIQEISRAEGVTPAVATQRLVALGSLPASAQATLARYGTQVSTAAKEAPGQWQEWWWVCLGCEALFLPFIFVLKGRWSPRRARQDARAHEEDVERQLDQLSAQRRAA